MLLLGICILEPYLLIQGPFPALVDHFGHIVVIMKVALIYPLFMMTLSILKVKSWEEIIIIYFFFTEAVIVLIVCCSAVTLRAILILID